MAKTIRFYVYRALACVIYELMTFEIPFPQGQKNNPAIPQLDETRVITPILQK